MLISATRCVTLTESRNSLGVSDIPCTWRYAHRGARAWAAMIGPRQCCNCVSTRLTKSRPLRACVGLRVLLDVLLLCDRALPLAASLFWGLTLNHVCLSRPIVVNMRVARARTGSMRGR